MKGKAAEQIIALIDEMDEISPADHARISGRLEALWQRTREAEEREELRRIGFPWVEVSPTRRRTTISPNFGLTEYPVIATEVAPGRWRYRIEDDRGKVLVENAGPGRSGLDWETCQLFIARFNRAIQCT